MIRVTVVDPGGDRNLRLRYRDPETRKQHWRSAKTRDWKRAERAAAAWEGEIASGATACADNISWAAFRQRVKAELLPGLALKTSRAYTTALNHAERVLAPAKPSALTTSSLSRLVAELRSGGTSESSIRSYLDQLAAVLSWARSVRMLSRVPAMPRVARAKKGGKTMRGRPLTWREIGAILRAVVSVVGVIAAPSWRRYLKGLWWSGLRLEESLEVYWDRRDKMQVDMSGEYPMLRVRAELEKGKEDRLLPLAPEFAHFLQRTPPEERHGPVFVLHGITDALGRPPRGITTSDPEWVGKILRRIGRAANVIVDESPTGKVKYASAHDLRKSFGLRWAQRVMPPVLQVLMRHKDIKTTMRYYVRLTADTTAATVWAAYARVGGLSLRGSESGSTRRNRPQSGEGPSEEKDGGQTS